MVEVAVTSGHGWTLARERDTLHRGELLVFKPGLSLEEEVIEPDRSISVTANQILVIHRQQNVDCALIDVQLHDLFKFFLTDLTDTCLDLRNFPDEDLSIGGSCDGFLGTGQEDSLSVGFFLGGAAVFASCCTVVLESL